MLINGGYILNYMLNETLKGRYLRAFVAEEGATEAQAEAAYCNMCTKRKLKGLVLKEELRYTLTTKLGLQKALCKFEGRSHTPDEYMPTTWRICTALLLSLPRGTTSLRWPRVVVVVEIWW